MYAREAAVGWGTFAAFFASALMFGLASGNLTLRVMSFLVGLGGGVACGVFAALATHLALGPAVYEPIAGADSAWGLAEYEDAGGEPPGRER